MLEPVRVAISGAAGNIGYSLVFRIAAGGLFGPEQPVILSLLEASEVWSHLQALEMELRDSAFPLLADVEIHTDPLRAFADSDWVVLLGSRITNEPVQSRIDLIRRNGPLFVDHGRAINEVCPTARIMVVATPCNTNAWIGHMVAKDIPRDHWFALNRLDRMRATSMIAAKAGVPVGKVNRVGVWGNQSTSVYIDFHNAFIGETPAFEVIKDRGWVREVLEPTVAHRTEEIIRLSGMSPAATAAQAILGTVRALTTPTPFERSFGAAVFSDGSYGVPDGLVFGLPLRTEDGQKWSIVQGLYLDDYAQERIAQNVAELEHEATVAQELLESYC